MCGKQRIFIFDIQLFIIILLGLSLILALLGTTTNQWFQSSSNEFNEGLWISCRRLPSVSSLCPITILHCHKQPYFKSQGLALSGVILLTIAFVLSIIYFYRRYDRLLAYLTVLILLGSTLLLIFSYLLYPRNIHVRQLGYSIYFMIISSVIVLVTTSLTTFIARTIQLTSTSTYLA